MERRHEGLRGYLIKSDKTCTRIETLSALESATAADIELHWLETAGEPAPETEAGRAGRGQEDIYRGTL